MCSLVYAGVGRDKGVCVDRELLIDASRILTVSEEVICERLCVFANVNRCGSGQGG